VSYTIPVTSTKRDRAVRFGRELERAMQTRGVGARPVAEAVDCGRTAVMYWRTGRILPRLESARKLAEALDWPRLVDLAVELRRKRCEVDDVPFVDETGSDNRRFCSMSCQRVSEKLRTGSTTTHRAANAERKLLVHQRAVAAYCAGCEPAGRCVTAECALRPVSPLPLFESRLDIAPARPKPHNGYREIGADSARMSRVWASYTPEERAARIAKTAQASKVGRGLVPA
jgi:hypothetical protein